MHSANKIGILLINLGTPQSYSVRDVRSYLREFLGDYRVINLPAIIRWPLVNLVITPFRAPKSAEAYKSIWTPQGSPLLVNSLAISNKTQEYLGDKYIVSLGMRYGKPSINTALASMYGVKKIIIIPLFPQYSSAATGSAIEYTKKILAKWRIIPDIEIKRDFHDSPDFIAALAEINRPEPDNFLLMSYHGLPEKHPDSKLYKEQCYRTSELLAAKLNLHQGQWEVSFQSRLGKTPWIKPYTDEMLKELRAKGINNINICCPSFVADCLETLEEIGIQAKKQWQQLGGSNFKLLPCLNSNSKFIQNFIQSII